MIPCCILLFVLWAFDIKAYYIDAHAVHILLLLFLHGWAMLPFMYLLSFIFTVPSSGFVWLTMFNILAGKFTNPILLTSFSGYYMQIHIQMLLLFLCCRWCHSFSCWHSGNSPAWIKGVIQHPRVDISSISPKLLPWARTDGLLFQLGIPGQLPRIQTILFTYPKSMLWT